MVGTLMTNMAVELALRGQGIEFVRARVGDRYVLEELEKRGWLLGGEGSGHLLALDKHTTGDGLVSALQVLQACVRSGKTRGAAAGRRDAVSADADQRASGARAGLEGQRRGWRRRRGASRPNWVMRAAF